MWGVAGAILATRMLATLKIICDRIQSLTALGHLSRGSAPGRDRHALALVVVAADRHDSAIKA
jgi:hypothetical protein